MSDPVDIDLNRYLTKLEAGEAAAERLEGVAIGNVWSRINDDEVMEEILNNLNTAEFVAAIIHENREKIAKLVLAARDELQNSTWFQSKVDYEIACLAERD